MARPTDYTDEIAEEAWAYVHSGWEEAGHAVPSVVGLCAVIGRAKSTIYRWANESDKQFRDILEAINELQELTTFNKALTGEYNATIAKLLLGKHGYKDNQSLEHTGRDGGPIKTVNRVEWTIQPVKTLNDL